MPSDVQYWFADSSEEFPPSVMLEHAKAAEEAGFDALGVSDHFAPWWPEGKATQAWVTLSAIGQHTTKPLATGVTPIVHHYHPGLVAQAWMALEELYPGRMALGVGSGEAALRRDDLAQAITFGRSAWLRPRARAQLQALREARRATG